MNEYVYFIQNTNTGLIKIGTALDPESRLSQLQTGNDDKLSLLGVVPGSRQEESQIHKFFAPYRHLGEWFRDGEDEQIRRFCKGFNGSSDYLNGIQPDGFGDQLPLSKPVEKEETDIKTYKTYDYDLFVFDPDNRDMDLKFVKVLANSIVKKNLLRHIPLLVKEQAGKLIIIDGQHRYRAAQQLGEAIYYQLLTHEFSREDINTLQARRNWKAEDYLKSYMSQGKVDYHLFKTFQNRNPEFNVTDCIRLLAPGKSGSDDISKFKVGEFVFPDDTTAAQLTATHIIDYLSVLSDVHHEHKQIPRKRHFMFAIKELSMNEDYDHGWVIRQTRQYPGQFYNATTVKDFVVMIERIQNKRRRIENQVCFR